MKSRQTIRVVLAGLGALLLFGVVLWVLHPVPVRAAPADTIRYVYGSEGTDDSDCTNGQDPCATVQYALAQAEDGDTIRVGYGVYSGTVAITRSVTLEGGWSVLSFGWLNWLRLSPCSPDLVTLNGLGAGRVISITGPVTPVIDCFTITGGDANGLGGDPSGNHAGGGIYSRDAAPLIINNVITGNYGCQTCSTAYGRGGGIYLLNSPATAVISNNLIAHNVADDSTWGQGGGILLENSDAQVLSNTIEYNRAGHSAGYGGGIAVKGGQPTIAENEVLHNVAGQSVQGLGGGVFVWSTTPTTIADNLIAYNQAINGVGDPSLASRGGGICYDGNPTVTAVIRDNVIHNNIASPLGPYGEGGGMYLSGLLPTSVIEGNRLEANIAGHNDNGRGGGVYVDDSEVTIAHNSLTGNSATWVGDWGWGGGLYALSSTIVIRSNVITGNFGGGFAGFPSTATGYGGGIAISNTVAMVLDNRIVGNIGTQGDSAGAGGGIYGYGGAIEVRGNTIADNRTSLGTNGSGGGAYLEEMSATVADNLIFRNQATGPFFARGGGVRLANCSDFTLTNNVIAQNEASKRGSGVAISSSNGTLAHNTIAQNYRGVGTGVEVWGGTVVLSNTILVSHTVGITVTSSGTATLGGTLWGSGLWANGVDWGGDGTIVTSTVNLWADPLFANPALDDYHLRAGSAAIDVGVDAGVGTDIDGEPRPRGTNPDLGADEFTCLARTGGVDYPAIQSAVNAATWGGTVQVAEGVCYENVAITRPVTLEGGWNTAFSGRHSDPAARTTINGAGLGRVISMTSVSGVVVDGFTLTGGDATDLGGSSPHSYDVGGGVYGRYSTVTVANCVVTDNVASRSTVGWGGGLGFYGGTVTLSNTQVLSNVASTVSSGYGGGAYFRHGKATVSSNTVEDNIASTVGNGYGGGMAFHFVTQATLRDNMVQGNRAAVSIGGQGGGLYVYHTAISMNGDRLEGNLASTSGNTDYGGGLYAREHSDLTVENVTVAGNAADNSGGGLYVLTSTLTLSDCAVYSNTAGTGGGGFLDDSDGALLTGNDVYSNTATYNGGGIYLWYSSGSTLTGNRVFGNRTEQQDGGGVAVGYSPNGVFEGNEVFDNEARYGAGWYLFYSDGDILTGNSVHDNEGSESGGGIYLLSSDDVTLEENDFASNRATSGAGVSLLGSSRVLLTDNQVHDNAGGEGNSGIEVHNSSGVTLRGNQIHGNGDGENGGVWIQQSNNITMTANVIYSNTCVGDGGGLYLRDTGTATLEENVIYRNTADYGGGMYLLDNPAPLRFINNIVADNQARSSGPGVYVKGCSPHLLHTTLARNTGGDGAGIYVTSGSAYLTNTILVSHTTGIYVSGDSTATLEATLWGSGPWANIDNLGGTGLIDAGAVNLWGPPAFLNPAASNYHIAASSAAVDAGVDAGVTSDIDGEPRVRGPDIGADEMRAVYLPLVMRTYP